MRERLLILLFATLAAASIADAQMPIAEINELLDKKNKTEIRVSPLLDQLPPSGYYPVRVHIYNGGKFERRWNFKFTSTDASYTDTGNELRSAFSVTCGSLQTVEVDLIVPVVTAFQQGYSTSVTLDLVVNSAPSAPLTFSLETAYEPEWPAVMISEKLYTPNKGNLTSEAGRVLSGSSGHGGGTSIEFGAAFNPKALAEDWRAYSGYDVCLLTEEDWRDLSPGARNALLRWNRLGGSIVIYSQAGSDLASLNIDGAAPGQQLAFRSWGTIRILGISSAASLDEAETVKVVHSTIPGATGPNKLSTVREDFGSSSGPFGWPLQNLFGKKAANIVFFIIVLIVFGILVGPVNLFVFAPSGKRHKLFITTPAISLGASALLVVLILFQDGFGGRGMRNVLIEIGPDNNAFVSQEQIARTGVLLSTSFTSSDPGYLSPVLIDESRWARITDANDGGNSRYTVDVLENGLKVAGDWFQSRSEHGHLFETIRPSRERIERVGTGEPPVITSTFQFPLETLYFLDEAGKLWTTDDVQQGRNVKLAPATDAQYSAWISGQQVLFTARNKLRIANTKDRRNHFFATASEFPGLGTLDAINWRETHTLISGPVIKP